MAASDVITAADTILSALGKLQAQISLKVTGNVAITGATKTKVTYDSKGLVTSGDDATTADIASSSNKRYVTDAQLTVIGNTSGTNTGDQTIALTGDVTGSGTGSFAATIANNAVTNAKIANSTIDLTAKVTGILPSANGGTGNGFTKFSGPATSEKTFTLPNTSSSLLYKTTTMTSGVVPRSTGDGVQADGIIRDNGSQVGVGKAASSSYIADFTTGDVRVAGKYRAEVNNAVFELSHAAGDVNTWPTTFDAGGAGGGYKAGFRFRLGNNGSISSPTTVGKWYGNSSGLNTLVLGNEGEGAIANSSFIPKLAIYSNLSTGGEVANENLVMAVTLATGYYRGNSKILNFAGAQYTSSLNNEIQTISANNPASAIGFRLQGSGSTSTDLCLQTTVSGTLTNVLYVDGIKKGVVFDQTGCGIYTGSGSPEGVVTAAIGSLFLRSDGGAGTSHYVKESGSGNTGWVAK